MKQYYRSATECLAKEKAKPSKEKVKPRRVKPVLVSGATVKDVKAMPSTVSKGQKTTARRLGRLEKRVKKSQKKAPGKDTAPWLSF